MKPLHEAAWILGFFAGVICIALTVITAGHAMGVIYGITGIMYSAVFAIVGVILLTLSLKTYRMVNLIAGVILVRDIMNVDVKSVKADSSVEEVVRKINRFDLGSIIVVQGNMPIGIITKGDILKKIVQAGLNPSRVNVEQIMSSPLVTIHKEAAVEEAAELMTKKKVKNLPVVEGGKLIGLVTAKEIVNSQPQLVSLLRYLPNIPPELLPETLKR